MPDANVDTAASALVAAGFGAAGQRCMALSTVVFVGGLKTWYLMFSLFYLFFFSESNHLDSRVNIWKPEECHMFGLEFSIICTTFLLLSIYVAFSFRSWCSLCLLLYTVYYWENYSHLINLISFFRENKLVKLAKLLKVNAGTEPDADLGPVISKQVMNPYSLSILKLKPVYYSYDM